MLQRGAPRPGAHPRDPLCSTGAEPAEGENTGGVVCVCGYTRPRVTGTGAAPVMAEADWGHPAWLGRGGVRQLRRLLTAAHPRPGGAGDPREGAERWGPAARAAGGATAWDCRWGLWSADYPGTAATGGRVLTPSRARGARGPRVCPHCEPRCGAHPAASPTLCPCSGAACPVSPPPCVPILGSPPTLCCPWMHFGVPSCISLGIPKSWAFPSQLFSRLDHLVFGQQHRGVPGLR